MLHSSSWEVVIPVEIDGRPVAAIGNVVGTIGAFQDYTNVTSVVIPDATVNTRNGVFVSYALAETAG